MSGQVETKDFEDRRCGSQEKLFPEAVADSTDRFDGAARSAEFFAQPLHVRVDGAGSDDDVGSPYILEEPVSSHYSAGSLHQVVQEIELFRGEHDFGAIDCTSVSFRIDR